ncbi:MULTISPECIES: CsoS2 family carboxysome shell protein [Prochlorococcus]|uniref:carboxysome assembly protein CsoS2 n=1 Tax=Prochlorococcus TaxID=1218 RepID=UPI0007B36C04|nr:MULTISPECIES: CsoS2 family carboxysome shell protein [Prochlorococcus]KZR80908.1 Carboxysome shell peptide mid-region [Prochlorococcus marinus str. MIT 1327]NMP05542.1 carboxysome shell protein [Prochlorococcus sp. P1361]
MAKQSSRELALERRRAQSNSGKKSTSLNGSSPNRTRNASDARVTRTDQSFLKTGKTSPQLVAPKKELPDTSFVASRESSGASRRQVKSIANPSRELVLARRDQLSRRGQPAAKSKDRTRAEVEKLSSKLSQQGAAMNEVKDLASNQKSFDESSANSLRTSDAISRLSPKHSSSSRPTSKRRSIQNPSRALVLARREAQSKHGKTAANQPTSAASVARQGDPDLSSREISQRVRELRSKSGSTDKKRSGACRPCGPNRNGSKQAVAADAHWKVGLSETNTGQFVTGTQANRSSKTTGNEASTCRSITGTQYLGSEVFDAFCQSSPQPGQPLKVAVTNTSHGNRVTGNEVGRSEKVTGDEPGTCKTLTGTEYISANQANQYCGVSQPSPRKVGQSITEDGRKVSGVMVGRSERVTGDEAGSNRQLTGDQYLGADPLPEGRPAEKVGSFHTLRGAGVTGTNVARSEYVTGNEPGSCKRVTGDEYVGTQQYKTFCGGRPNPEAAKVGLSLTNKSQTVSGTLTGRSELVTGDEPGTCKAVTGTPYGGLEQAAGWCDTNSVREIQDRTPKMMGTPGAVMTGLQPGVGGVMTGAEKGACEPLTGTPYVGGDQLAQACGSDAPAGSELQQDGQRSAPWTHFSVQSPARAAHVKSEQRSGVTGTSYEQGSQITGPFNMAVDKITGTEQFRFDRKQRHFKSAPVEETPNDVSQTRPESRVTGEGQSAGLNITGDDWDRSERVTGTEGASARRRNPTRPGPMSAMPAADLKRNEEVSQPMSRVTGSSGNTDQGSLITVSGGARG